MKTRSALICAVLALMILMAMFAFAGCGKGQENNNDEDNENVSETLTDFEGLEMGLNAPAEVIDVVEWDDGKSNGHCVFSARTLQGLINKKQPRVYITTPGNRSNVDAETVRLRILQEYGEVGLNWLPENSAHSGYNTFFTIWDKYKTEVKRLYVYSDNPSLSDSMNVAAMLGGRNEGIAVCQELADLIVAENSGLEVINVMEYMGLPDEKANTFGINEWIRDNMIEGSNKQFVFCSTPSPREELEDDYFRTYDLAIATDSLIYYAWHSLDAGKELQKSILDQFPSAIPVIGWGTIDNEWDFIASVSNCGKCVLASGWNYGNGSVWGAFPSWSYNAEGESKVVNPVPENFEVADNQVYVAFTMSDGDSLQASEKDTLCFWETTVHGNQPIGWTVPVMFADFCPLILEYLYDTQTEMDDLMQGACGAGYIYASEMPEADYEIYLQKTQYYFRRMGMNMVNYWDRGANFNSMVGVDKDLIYKYADMVDLDAIWRGHNSPDPDYEIYNDTLLMCEIGNRKSSGTLTAQEIIDTIDFQVQNKKQENKPLFLMIQLSCWGDGVHIVQQARDILDTRADAGNYSFVTPTELIAGIRAAESGKITEGTTPKNRIQTLDFQAGTANDVDLEERLIVENDKSYNAEDYRFTDGGSWTYEFRFNAPLEYCTIGLGVRNRYKISGSVDGTNFTELARHSNVLGEHFSIVFTQLDIMKELQPADVFYLKFENTDPELGFGPNLNWVKLKYITQDDSPLVIPEKSGQEFVLNIDNSALEQSYIVDKQSQYGLWHENQNWRYADINDYWVYGFAFGSPLSKLSLKFNISGTYIIEGSANAKDWFTLAVNETSAKMLTETQLKFEDAVMGGTCYYIRFRNAITDYDSPSYDAVKISGQLTLTYEYADESAGEMEIVPAPWTVADEPEQVSGTLTITAGQDADYIFSLQQQGIYDEENGCRGVTDDAFFWYSIDLGGKVLSATVTVRVEGNYLTYWSLDGGNTISELLYANAEEPTDAEKTLDFLTGTDGKFMLKMQANPYNGSELSASYYSVTIEYILESQSHAAGPGVVNER